MTTAATATTGFSSLPNLGERASAGVAPVGPRSATWERGSVKVAAAVGLCGLALSVVLPPGTTALSWFIPVADSMMILLFAVVAALGSLDAILRRHGRSVPLAAAAAGSAVLWVPHMLTFPGVLGPAGWIGPQSAAYLFDLAHIGTPVALALALILRPGPLDRPVRATVTAMAAAVAIATALIGLVIGLAPHLPVLVVAHGFTSFSKALTYVTLVPIVIAAVIFVGGRRGDDRVATSVAAALVLLLFESLAEAAVPRRFATGWYINHGLGVAPALALLIGQLTLYARTVLDQTRDEAALREAETRLRGVVAGATEAFIEIDSTGLVISWNDRAEQLFGWSASEVIGRALSETIIPRNNRQAHLEGLARYRRTRQTSVLGGPPLSLTALRRDGTEFPVEISLWPVDASGTVTFSAFVRDISERKVAEAKLKRSTEELARSNADLEAFASVAAHDLISPLTVVGGFAQMLENELTGDELAEARNWASRIVHGTTRMKTLVDDLLAYARLGSDLTAQPVDTAELMSELVATVRATSESAGEISIGPLPIVNGDRTQLSQLFQNLLTNALKFTADGRTARVEVSAVRSDDSWIFAVADDGIGIALDAREVIFKMFERLHPGELYGGTGIGLAICRRVADNHGGRIWAEGNDHGGATIRVALPDRA